MRSFAKAYLHAGQPAQRLLSLCPRSPTPPSDRVGEGARCLYTLSLAGRRPCPILRFGTYVRSRAGLVQASTPYLPKDWEQGVDLLQTWVRATVTRRHVST